MIDGPGVVVGLGDALALVLDGHRVPGKVAHLAAVREVNLVEAGRLPGWQFNRLWLFFETLFGPLFGPFLARFSKLLTEMPSRKTSSHICFWQF